MKILKSKFLIPTMVVLLLSVAIFTRLSFMFADEDNGESDKSLVSAATLTEGMTIIDYIIENSHIEDVDVDTTYHVLEITSGSTDVQSALGLLISNTNDELAKRKFESLVLNGHKSSSQTKDMVPKKIDYQFMNMKASDTELINAINKADLIYFSEDTTSNATLWSATNDITEDVKIALSKYATSDQKPIMFDSHNLSMQYKNATTKDFISLATNYFSKEGTAYSTYKWPASVSVAGLMNPADLNYMYIPVYGSTNSANGVWDKGTLHTTKTLTEEQIGKGEKLPADINVSVAKVLTITTRTDGKSNRFAKLKACCESSTYVKPADYEFTDDGTITSTYDFSNVYPLTKTSDLFKFGYYGLGSRPDAIKFDTCTVAKSGDNYTYSIDLTSIDLSQYDFILVEGDLKDSDGYSPVLPDAAYNAMVSAMYSGVHILYDDVLVNTASDKTIAELKADNIKYVYDKIATATDSPKFNYVLVTARARMDIYAKATKPKGVKDIADIINNGSFRGIKSSDGGDSSNMYTVLEIEPCYPINTVLAKKLYDIKGYKDPVQKNQATFLSQGSRGQYIGQKQYYGSSAGFYYIRTDQVSGSTSDEISYGDGYSLTSLLEDLEYYNNNAGKVRGDFGSDEEFSAHTARLADAQTNINTYFLTGSNADTNVNNKVADIVDYYNWSLSRAKIAHATGRSYDQVNVVHMSAVEFATTRKTLLDNFDAIYIGGDNSAIKDTIGNGTNAWYLSTINGANYYTMYFHNGDAYPLSGGNYNESLGNFNYGLFAGNDLTKSKYDELVTYASKMPVIIDKKLSDAYALACEKGYDQHLLDPESNMFNFLKKIASYDKNTKKITPINSDYTLVNFDSSYTYKAVNADNKYGKTYGGYVTVFRGDSPVIEYEYETEMETVYDYEIEYETEPDVYVVEKDEDGNEKLDENGNVIYKLDENGKRIINYDADNKPIVRTDADGGEWYTFKLDDKGEKIPILDEDGNYTYLLDKDGNKIPKLDENGDPIVIRQEPKKDKKGNIIYKLDENGNKILKGYNLTSGSESNLDAFGYDFSNEESAKAFAATAKTGVVNETKLGKVLSNRCRPLLAVLSTPSIYSEDDRSTWIDTEASNYKGLVWKVSVSEEANVTAYVDNNGNGRFDADEAVTAPTKVAANTTTTLSYTPGADYFGVVYWKVEAVSTKSNLKVSTTNVSKIKRKSTQEKLYVNLLQIMAGRDVDSQSAATGNTNYSKRSLFLCTDCQYTKNVLHGNRFTTEGMFFAKVDSGANSFSELDDNHLTFLTSTAKIEDTLKQYEKDYKYNGTRLGSHTHDFGITKYFTNLSLLGDKEGQKGFDDVTTNWFYQIMEDYDVDTTILYTNEFEDKINEVKELYVGKTKDEVNDMINNSEGGFLEKSNTYNTYYRAMRDIINGKYTTTTNSGYSLNVSSLNSDYPGFYDALVNTLTASGQYTNASDAQAAIETYATASFSLDKFIIDHKATIAGSSKKKYVTEQMLGDYLDKLSDVNQDPNIPNPRDKRKYYDVFNNFNEFSSDTWVNQYAVYYCQWRDAKIFENFFFEMYQKYLLYSSYDYEKDEVVLGNVYNCIALGAAEGFYDDDIADQNALDALSRYIDDNKNLFLFHDTLSSVKGATTKMTQALSSDFGMNARHMYISHDNMPQDNEISVSLDGHDYSEPLDLSRGILNRSITFRQVVDRKIVDGSVSYTIDGKKYNIDDFDSKATGYNINVKKTVSEVSKIQIYIAQYDWQFNNNVYVPLDIPVSAKKVSINFTKFDSDAKIVVEEEVSDPDEPHTIEIVNKGSSNIYVALNGHTHDDIVCNPLNVDASYKVVTEAFNEYYNDFQLAMTTNYDIDANFGSIPREATEITLHVKFNNDSFASAEFEVTGTTDDDGLHKVKIVCDTTFTNCHDWYNPSVTILTIDATEHPGLERHLYKGTNLPLNGSIEIDNTSYHSESINNISPDKMSAVSYSVENPVKSTEVFDDGFGTQTFTVNVNDGENGISGEQVTFEIDGVEQTKSTDAEGNVQFTRKNYTEEIKDYKHVPEKDSFTTVSSNSSQTLTVNVIDDKDNPVQGVEVKATQSSEYTNSINKKDTSGSGAAAFTYYNYFDDSSGAGIIVREPGYSKDTYRVTTVQPDSSGKETFNYSPRMLAFKGYFVNLDPGTIDGPQYTMMYKYALYHKKVDEASNISANIGANNLQDELASSGDNNQSMPTDKTSQVNEGIITKYPFGIGSSMKVSATTPQSYPVDIEDDDLVVYYTLAGGTQGTSSAAFAADPKDGINNYFLYQNGSITYTGAGHMKLTGYGLENNDERRLFINVIVNSGRKSIMGPSLELFDLPEDDYVYDLNEDGSRKKDADGHYVISDPKRINVEREGTNKIIKAKPGAGYDYYTEIEDLTDFKGFDYLAKISPKSDIKEVLIYYDVDHNLDGKDGKYRYDQYAYEVDDDGNPRTDAAGNLVLKKDSAGNNIPLDRLIFNSGKVVDTDTSKQVLPNVLKSITTGLTEELDDAGFVKQAEVKRTQNLEPYNASDPMLALREEFFDKTGEGGQYAYIVVQVTDSNDEKVSKVLRIQKKAELIDLN